MYKLKGKYLRLVAMFGYFGEFDIHGSYSKDVWLKKGFKEYILEECLSK
jgi:hypothetical protein